MYFLLQEAYFPPHPALTPIGGEGEMAGRFEALPSGELGDLTGPLSPVSGGGGWGEGGMYNVSILMKSCIYSNLRSKR